MPAASGNAGIRTVAESMEARILDAALARFEKVGVKKTTIEDIARQAGLDRVTVYRRMGSRDDLVQAVISREVAAVLTEITTLAEGHDRIEELVAAVFVTVITRWRTHPLVATMLSVEPERVVSKLTFDGGEQTFAMTVAATTLMLEGAAARGLLPSVPDLSARAEVVCRVVHSMILAPHGVDRLLTEGELADYARRYLAPILTSE
ncbi:helix-turn-helix domain-containing protein [Nocardia sp. NPDC004654]|uniref:TetR/AcrR family transcriptional regulator n=1 Tax=Nocardia sp. NPDC004654 TaxID=3154776 RepID=UPI0033AA3716